MDPMNDAGLERDIERALAVDPSPEFVARVRTRIAEEPSPASRGFGWLFLGVATATVAAAVVLAVFVVSPARRPASAPLLASRAIGSVVEVPSVSSVGADPRVRPESRVRPERRVRPESPSSVGPTPGSAPTTTGVVAEPATLFDQRETMALQRLIAGVRDARVDLTLLLKDPPMALQSLEDLVIPAITIEPLVPGGLEGERP
jgi:hypothetical protein